MKEKEKLRKKIEKEYEDIIDVDENSDIPISEKKTKEKHIKK
jgi:hypothetical protein